MSEPHTYTLDAMLGRLSQGDDAYDADHYNGSRVCPDSRCNRMRERFDDIVIGTGIAGLETARLLQGAGRSVCIIESAAMIGTGATTHNEGWLHAGTYHAGAIPDRCEAIKVGRLCKYGFDRIVEMYPQSISPTNARTYAIIRDDSAVDETTSRWAEAGVKFDPVSLSTVLEQNAELNFAGNEVAFRVSDLAISTPELMKLIYREIQRQNCCSPITFAMAAKIVALDPSSHRVQVVHKGEMREFRAENIIYAAGVGNRELAARFLDRPDLIRLFRGHIVIMSKLTIDQFVVMDKGSPTWMNHAKYSVIGMTRMSEEVTTEDYSINRETADNIVASVQSMILQPVEVHLTYSCLKPTITDGQYQSLAPSLLEPEKGNYLLLPGKMTEAPVICEALLDKILNRQLHVPIAVRPVDELAKAAG